MKIKRFVKKTFVSLFILVFLVFLFVFSCDLWVTLSTRNQLSDSIKDLPYNKVALVLGTSKYVPGGRKNLYFYNRIDAAFELYKSGKVKHFILSGDNSLMSYNEPIDMKKALMKKGVPEKAITLDYAGFRTLDSVVRCSEVFQQKKFTVVSQKFHNHRALFIANHYGLEVTGFNAKKVKIKARKMFFRERLARCKAVIDLYVLNKQPKFLGEKIEIE